MIIRCPSCNTRYDLPSSRFDADGTMMKCASCGHSWLEGRIIDIAYEPVKNLPEIAEPRYDADAEIRRLVDATRGAEEAFAQRRKKKRKAAISWVALLLAVATPFAAAAAFPETTVRLMPATMVAYDWVGWPVNIYGLAIRRVETQHLNSDGTAVIAIKGEIANTSPLTRKIPWLRFALLGSDGKEVYEWQLDTNARPLQPGESTSFVTRIASPPAQANTVAIRFAHLDEIASAANP